MLINTWEAVYFNIDEKVICRYAEKAKALGMDMLVMDDGWFGTRNNAQSGLGDWVVNGDKFPRGLKGMVEKIRACGLKFGIWIEPEMVNPDSNLFRAHPDWVLQCKGRECSLGRNQLVLDLTKREAVDYIADSIIKVLQDVRPDYIKWDFNRSLTEVGSLSLPAERQGEVSHRFVLGSYRLHEKLTKAFPDTLFEGCSGGGGRFDAGILYYCPQIWASDQTDPARRLPIQLGTATVYPLSAIGSHVSNRKSNRLESTQDYRFRFGVTLGGMTGYEMDITKLTEEEDEEFKAQTAAAKKYQTLIMRGDLYRCDGLHRKEYAFAVVSEDKTEFLFNYSSLDKHRNANIRLNGLLEDREYVGEDGRIFSGDRLMRDGLPVEASDRGKYAYAFGYFQVKK